MAKSKYSIIGVMSGTSLDGVDLVYATFVFEKTWHFEINVAETIAYNDQWRQVLKNLVSYSTEELKRVDEKYTIYLADIIKRFIEENKISRIDAVCSHGHTALHQPNKGVTYQIGNLSILATLLKKRVVCDFRVQDVKLGGQGAPLVPIGDALLFSQYDYCLNLGGFANVSTEKNNIRIAYDVCPVNIVLNHYVNTLGLDYDDGGKMASKGKINHTLLDALNALEFYGKPYPKSLGLEWVKEGIFPLIDDFKFKTEDILNTCIEHIAIQISKAIENEGTSTVLVTGGGAFNTFLINRIASHSKTKIVIPEKNIIEFKEALIFAFLGVLKLRNEVNCLKSVTGASKNHSSGIIYIP